MNKNEIPLGIETESGELAFEQIHRDFSLTEYGAKLAHTKI